MISSVSNAIKNIFFDNKHSDSALQGQRKRKRPFEESDSVPVDRDPDVEIVSVKKPRLQANQQPSESGFFTGFLNSTTVQHMSDWVHNGFSFSKMFGSKKKDKLPKSNIGTAGSQATGGLGFDGDTSQSSGQVPGLAAAYIYQGKQRRSDWEQPVRSNGRTFSRMFQTRIQARPALHPAGKQSQSVQTDLPEDNSKMPGLPKSRSSGSFISYNSRSTAAESVRLDEKWRYHQLIQGLTSVPLKNPEAPPKESAKSSISKPVLPRAYLNSNDSIQHKKPPVDRSESRRLFLDEDTVSRPRLKMKPHRPAEKNTLVPNGHTDDEVIDLTDLSPIPQSRREIPNVTIDLTEDDSNSRTKYDPLKYRSTTPVETDYRQSKFVVEDWIKDISSQYNQKARERERLLAETEIRAKIYEEKRKAKEEELETRIRNDMKLHEKEPAVPVYIPVDDIEQAEEKEEVFPELTPEMMKDIRRWSVPNPSGEVLVDKFRLQITRADLKTLQGLNWLNDEVINFYMNLLMERGEEQGHPKVYAFNTFFYPKIMSGGHSAVRRWTRRVDVLAKDYILIPVHLGMHWCLAVVDFKKKEVQYYDSMGGTNMQCLNAIKQYLREESLDKKKQDFDLSGWNAVTMMNIPQQMNGSDCGMFACKYAEYITRQVPITFTQEHMPYFRQRMVYEIVKAKLLQ